MDLIIQNVYNLNYDHNNITHTHSHQHTHGHTPAHTHTHSLTHTNTHTNTHTYTHTQTQLYMCSSVFCFDYFSLRALATRAHTRTLTRTLTHTLTHAHSHTLSHTHKKGYAATGMPIPLYTNEENKFCFMIFNVSLDRFTNLGILDRSDDVIVTSAVSIAIFTQKRIKK